MEIKLTEEEYKTLVEMVYLGECMINSIRTPAHAIKKYENLEQYVYSFAKDAGLEKYIYHDAGSKMYFPSQEMESVADKYRTEYESEVFWDELEERLACRDMYSQYGEGAIKKMSGEEWFKKNWPFVEKYKTEFEKNVLENLQVTNSTALLPLEEKI